MAQRKTQRKVAAKSVESAKKKSGAAKKRAARKSPAKKAAVKKAAAKKPVAKKTPSKKAPTRKATARRASPARSGVKSTTPQDRVRAIIAQWPETSEKLSHGSPTFWGGRKTFCSITDKHPGDGRFALWIKSTHDAQSDLVAMNPTLFFVPPYVGPSGWVGVRLDRGEHWDVVEALLLEGYRLVAPARALKQLEGL